MNATELTAIESLKSDLDEFFLITNGILVSLMQAGFASLEAGAVRSKNATNIMMKNLLDMFICALVYFLIGYSLSYGTGSPYIGLTWWAGDGLSSKLRAHWFFQFVFAATAATIVSGAVAERCHFIAYIVYSAAISGVIYPIASHWVWSDEGWLLQKGYMDFAGCGPVHALAGVCSFVGAALLGPRIDRFQNGHPIDLPGHSTPLTGIGALLLVSGFLAFNGGSLGHISETGDGAIVAQAVISTVMGGSGGATLSMILGRVGMLGSSKWPFTITLNSLLTGMVSICAGANVYAPWEAFLVGFMGSVFYLGIHALMLKIKVDDPLDAVAVHFGGGFWGVLAAPIFCPGGVMFTWTRQSLKPLLINLIGLSSITAWAAVTSFLLFGGLSYFGYLRVDVEKEMRGLDRTKHGETSYPASAWEATSVVYCSCASGEAKRSVNYNNIAFRFERTRY